MPMLAWHVDLSAVLGVGMATQAWTMAPSFVCYRTDSVCEWRLQPVVNAVVAVGYSLTDIA